VKLSHWHDETSTYTKHRPSTNWAMGDCLKFSAIPMDATLLLQKFHHSRIVRPYTCLLWMKLLRRSVASMRDGWRTEAVSIAQSCWVCALVLLSMSHHANGSTHTSNLDSHVPIWTIGAMLSRLTHPTLSCANRRQLTSIVQ